MRPDRQGKNRNVSTDVPSEYRITSALTLTVFIQTVLLAAFNLHNFNSWLSENLYYTTAFCAFVLLPYAATDNRKHWHGLTVVLTPMPAFAVVAAPVAFMQGD